MVTDEYRGRSESMVSIDGRVFLNTAALKRYRRTLGMSQLGLAEYSASIRLPISIASIKRAELGKPVILRTAIQLSKLFNVKVEVLIIDTVHKTSDDNTIRNQRPNATAPTLQMVGRKGELKYITYLLSELINQNSSRFIYIRGDAGIGKSRMLEEISASEEGKLLKVINCKFNSNMGGGGVIALAPLIYGCLGIDESLDLEIDSNFVRTHLQSYGFTDDTFIYVCSILGVEIDIKDQNIFSSLTHDARMSKFRHIVLSIARISTRVQKALFIIDDAHWANELILGLIGWVISNSRNESIIWIMTSRLEKDPLDLHLRPYLDDLPVSIIELLPLSPSESRKLALQLLPIITDHHGFAIEQAKGNPLFLTQLISGSDYTSVPKSLSDIIDFKINLLHEKDLIAIQLAAAFEREIDLAAMRELCGDLDYYPYLPIKLRILRHFGDNSFIYVHDLVMRVVYSRIHDAELPTLHLKIAEYLEGKDDKFRAIHLVKAKSPQGAEFLLNVIYDRFEAFNFIEALDLLIAYKKITYIPIDQFQLHYLEGLVLSSMGESEKARVVFQNALNIAITVHNELTVVVELAKVLNVLDELNAEVALLDAYIQKAKTSGNHKATGQLLYLKGNLLFPKGEHLAARKLQLSAREAASRANDPRTEALALSGLGDSYYAEGRMHTATRIFKECLSICEQFGLKHIESSNRLMLATTRLYLNETAAALDDALASAALAVKVGNLRAEIVSQLTVGWLQTSIGEISEAITHYEMALRTARQIGARRFEPFILEGVAKCQYILGQKINAHQTIQNAWDLVQEQSLYKFIGPWILGTFSMIEPDVNKRKILIDRGLNIISSGCIAHNHYRFYVSAAESHILSHDAGAASIMATRLELFTNGEPCAWADHHISLIRAHVSDLLEPHVVWSAKTQSLIEHGNIQGLGGSSPVLHSCAQ